MIRLLIDSLEGLPEIIAVVVRMESWFACVAASISALLLASSLPRVRGTTLLAPLLWAIVAGIGLAAIEAFFNTSGADISPLSVSMLRYATAIGTLCPLMAVLGAKRPQNRGWQWIVLSLWVILMLPAAQAMLISPGRQLNLFVAWRLFLGAMIGLGLLNYLPTRFWLAALLVACGQVLLLDSFLWKEPFVSLEWGRAVGVACFLAATVTVCMQLALKTSVSPGVATPELWGELDHYNQQWLRFRNAFGAFWALRILQRINQTAEVCDWPVRLAWTGFLPTDDAPADALHPDHLAEIDQTLQTLLRRFN